MNSFNIACMKTFLIIGGLIIIVCILEAYRYSKEIKDDSFDGKSECCGARYIGETDLCSECKEHTGRET